MDEPMTMLHLYTGEGKGKTTAAMGLALRALGCGWPVYIAQFLKTGESGELEALRQIDNATIEMVKPIGKFTFAMSDEERRAAKLSQSAELKRIRARLDELKPKMMVFDELAMAMDRNMIEPEDVIELLEQALLYGEVVITGRYAPQILRDRADYLSEIRKEKHPFERGIHARKGIEY